RVLAACSNGVTNASVAIVPLPGIFAAGKAGVLATGNAKGVPGVPGPPDEAGMGGAAISPYTAPFWPSVADHSGGGGGAVMTVGTNCEKLTLSGRAVGVSGVIEVFRS